MSPGPERGSAPVGGAPGAVPAPDGGSPVGHALRRLSVYVRRNAGYYVLCALTTFVYVGGFLSIPVLVGRAVKAAVDGAPRDVVATDCALLFAATLVTAVARYFSRTLVFNAAREVEYEIRNDLFAHLQRLPQSFFGSWRTGDLMSRCVNDLNSVRLLLGPGLLSTLQSPILFAGAIGLMVSMNAFLAMLVLLPYPLFVVIARLFGAQMHARNLAVQMALADASSQVQEAVSGIGVVKAYAMEAEQERRFDGANQSLFRRHLALVHVQSSMPAITGLLPMTGLFFVLLVGVPMIQEGRMGVDDFFTFTMLIFQLTFPTFILGWVFALLQRGAASMQRIDEILSTPPSIADAADARPVRAIDGEIELRGLSFAYGDGPPVLRDVSLHVPAGTSLGVVGPVGSGKSTLASLVPRLLEVPDGQLFVDGVDVNRIPLAVLRGGIAMVPQDSFLFSMSLADNVAFGLPETNLRSVERAAERAQLAKDVTDLPAGYATLVGERGVMLSGGQRQRTALARALAMDPRILILDDTLSAVDAETEAAIQHELAEVFRGRTVLVVASRVSSVRECDQIAVLDDGRIVERGTHAELLRRGGLYARLALEQEEADEPQAELGS